MSRLAKKPILLPAEVKVSRGDKRLIFKGPKGETSLPILPLVDVLIDNEGSLKVVAADSDKRGKANSGTMWSLIQNSIKGVREGFSKVLEIEGVGFRAVVEGNTLVLSLGYVNPVRFELPEGITVAVEKNMIKISGINKELVGRAAAEIRSLKKPEPYKGKGIRYQGEVIKRKVGKRAGATTAASA